MDEAILGPLGPYFKEKAPQDSPIGPQGGRPRPTLEQSDLGPERPSVGMFYHGRSDICDQIVWSPMRCTQIHAKKAKKERK